ncbi:MAG: CoA ligase [Deltaproteobacteria bacterium HGW-Deltaproteobacteria-17]|nr:MAG: CoA ligase [Deltaproteobacteria bacterium HGW-Deltaproteobacteria-17]
MIHEALSNPGSIVVVGASNDVTKPGGKVLKNLLDGAFDGPLYGINPRETQVQGVPCFASPAELPAPVELAIVSIPAPLVARAVEDLILKAGCRSFIVLSAGFKEMGPEGEALQVALVELVERHGACMIGPNCMGVLTTRYRGTFAGPIPSLDPAGVDFASGSGATAAFIMEAGMEMGLSFASMFSVGNSAQVGVEDILAWWDETFDPARSPRVKLVYMEKIDQPGKFLRHAASLIAKGCRIAGIKAGASEAGNRAASSHTGAMASSDTAVEALFRKAGVLRCHGREDLMLTAAVFQHKPLDGRRIAIVTHAGGPGVLLSDSLSKGGFTIPRLTGPGARAILEGLFPGSSVQNPIDFLATGTADQLRHILDMLELHFADEIDGVVVIFGTPGLADVTPVYRVIHEKQLSCRKPIFAVLPSVMTAHEAIREYQSWGGCNFTDEVLLGYTLNRAARLKTYEKTCADELPVDRAAIRAIVDRATDGYLPPSEVAGLLDAAGIPRAAEVVVTSADGVGAACDACAFPLVMKVIGPVHKTDVGGVVLDVGSPAQAQAEFERLMGLPQATGVLFQPMLAGTELFIGATREGDFGHLVLCGLGGIYIEVFRDVAEGLAPICAAEADDMIRRLRSYPLFSGVRGRPGLSAPAFARAIRLVSALCQAAPEIAELDVNPLLASPEGVFAVDARIRIQK